MQAAPPGSLPDARREQEALIREARRRQRRRWLAAGTALLVVSAAALAAIADSGSGRRAPGRPVTAWVKAAPSAMTGVPMPASTSVRI